MRRWFLSYNSSDQALAERLAAALTRRESDTHVFFAPKNLRAGGYWQPALAEEIAQATAFVLLVGERGLGPWQVVEYYEALDRRVKAPDFPVVLVLLDGQPAPGLPFLRQLHWIITADPASEQPLARLTDAASGGGTRPGELWRYTSPYRGLAAMTEADSDFFFGRERETVEVLEALAAAPDRLPVLLGNSGVGKSSLAQAGVLAAVKRQAWPEGAAVPAAWPHVFHDSRRWCFLKLTPGAEPLKALVDSFLDIWQFAATDAERVRQQNSWIELLLERKGTLRDLLDATERRYWELDQPKPPTFFLYVDQGEELYVRAEERQRRRFSEVLAQGLGDPRLIALMSLRSDFLGALQNDEPLYAVHRKIDVPPLREAELREVVGRPARLLSARFETEELAPDIARRAAEESAKDAGALPLLSYLLDDMWTQMVKRGDGVLRLPAQAMELGGVLADRADAFLARHPTAEQALRRVLTLKLATVREDGEPTRRRAQRSEFSEEEWRLVSELADHPHRLLITATPEGGATYAEVAHEAIFRRWAKLRDWMAGERDFLVWRSALEADRRSWEAASEPSRNDALLMGLALAQAQSWVVKRAEDLPRADRDFIELSLRREALERQQRESLRRRAFATALVALVVVSALAVLSLFQWREAERQRAEAVKQEQLAQQERDRAEQALANVPRSAQAYIARGMAFREKGDYDRAIQDFDEAIKIDPTNTFAYYFRGLVYHDKSDYDRALADFDEAIRLSPTIAFSYVGRGRVYAAKGDFDQAIADYDEAIRLDPRQSGFYVDRGDAFYSSRAFDRAIVDYDQAIALNPKSAGAYNGRGNSYFQKRDYDRAIADYDQAIALDPSDASYYENRGNAHRAKDDHDRAIADYDQAIKLDPSRAGAYNHRGFAYALKGEYDRAIADYDQAIKLAPKLVLAYLNRGLAFAAKGDYERAIADYSEAIKLDPGQAVAYYGRGLAFAAKSDHERAIADYSEALKLDPRYAAAYSKRGELYATTGDYGRAIADYDAVIALEPRDADAWNSRCWARAVVDQLQAALADCNEALRLRPDDPQTFDSRGFTYLKLGRLDDAIADYDTALKLDAKLVESLYGRGVAKLRKGDIAGGNADIAAAKAIKPGIAEEFARYGVR